MSVVSVTAMFAAAPAVVMATSSAPAIVMSTPSTVHLAVAVSMTALDQNNRILLRGRSAARCDSEPRGNRRHHRQHRGKYHDSAQRNSSHSRFLRAAELRPVTIISRVANRSSRPAGALIPMQKTAFLMHVASALPYFPDYRRLSARLDFRAENLATGIGRSPSDIEKATWF
jgi:hypothetical protein